MNVLSKVILLSPALLIVGCSSTSNIQMEQTEQSSMETSSISEEININELFNENFEIDSELSTLSFIGKSSIINHEGFFEEFTVNIIPDKNNPSDPEKASIEVVIDINSITSDSERLTEHLKAEDFFNTEKYPEATFVSKEITKEEDNTYSIIGDLTIKGTTDEATLTTKLNNEHIVMEFNLPRKDFNIGNDSYGNKLLNEEVPVTAILIIK